MISKEDNERLTQVKAGTPVGDLLRLLTKFYGVVVPP